MLPADPVSDTIQQLLQRGSEEAVAIAAPGRVELSYGQLRRQVEKTVAALNRLGVRSNDSVAIVLPNGPEMAVTFLAVAAGATAAPLNPAYREAELEFYLGDLEAKLVIVAAGAEGEAARVARRLGIPVAELRAKETGAAGTFELVGPPAGAPVAGGFAQPEDAALVLHTSGTTSRPKIVPLSQRNVCASAAHTREALNLKPHDRCLNVMPLFHIHGLMGVLLSSLSAGASVFCTPGFNALKFFSWLEEAQPSWYSAVPTMHQAILARAERNREVVESVPLDFIRSSSASLPPQVLRELETTFEAPVIEAYGMTEAAHQMASNPLPPAPRKPGSVGIAAGPEVGVMDEAGTLLPAGRLGEVVIRGPNVTAGYRNNPEANATAFTNGWFRTGDQGFLDEDGYLTLTGRLKEIINRGGEKISPREVDEVILDHPAVRQVVTFALPHDRLGEEVAAAVVLEAPGAATEGELRDFAQQKLADFKVPRRIVFVEEIPKGATGKLQRIGLAEKLGLA